MAKVKKDITDELKKFVKKNAKQTKKATTYFTDEQYGSLEKIANELNVSVSQVIKNILIINGVINE